MLQSAHLGRGLHPGIHPSHDMAGILFQCSRCGGAGVDLLNASPCLTDEEIRVMRNIQSVFDRQQKRASALFMCGI